MTGQQFVNKALEYSKSMPNSPIKMDSAYVVKQNVEKSKHLETTALDIAGLKIDFVNLRDESYGESSRVPIKRDIQEILDAIIKEVEIVNVIK